MAGWLLLQDYWRMFNRLGYISYLFPLEVFDIYICYTITDIIITKKENRIVHLNVHRDSRS